MPSRPNFCAPRGLVVIDRRSVRSKKPARPRPVRGLRTFPNDPPPGRGGPNSKCAFSAFPSLTNGPLHP